MKKELDRVNPFRDDGTLKASSSERLMAVSVVDVATGEMKTSTKKALDAVSKVDRRTGLPKEA